MNNKEDVDWFAQKGLSTVEPPPMPSDEEMKVLLAHYEKQAEEEQKDISNEWHDVWLIRKRIREELLDLTTVNMRSWAPKLADAYYRLR